MPVPEQPVEGPSAAAVDHVRRAALAGRAAALERVRTVADVVDADLDALAAAVGRSPVALHLHPDRIARDGVLVVDALRATGRYRSQFATGISNGGLDPLPGGARDRWESGLFGGAYAGEPWDPDGRPVYGGLDLLGHPDGPCPRFGSCRIELAPHVHVRTTLCHGDSHLGPTDVGTPDAAHAVLAGLLEDAARRGVVLGRAMGVGALLAQLRRGGGRGRVGGVLAPAEPPGQPVRAVDDYVEAQVHGPVDLRRDAVGLVADPSFAGTAVGAGLTALAEAHDLALRWHAGFELPADEVPDDVRGPLMPVLAERVVRAHADDPAQPVDAELVGRAARSVVTDPGAWADWPPPALQHLKQLWHVLVLHGRARTSR